MSNYPTYLIHYGIQGQKWGTRRYQNEDGTWTEEGLKRRRQYFAEDDSSTLSKKGVKIYNEAIGKMKSSDEGKEYERKREEYYKKAREATNKSRTAAYKAINREPSTELIDSYLDSHPKELEKWRKSYSKIYDSLREKYLDKEYNELLKAEERYISVGQKYLDKIAGKNILDMKKLMHL